MSAAISTEMLRKLLRCNPETGELFWLYRDQDLFTSKSQWKTWNTRFADKLAFISRDAGGYRRGEIFGRPHKAHRVIWALVYGEWPRHIDHINGDPADNRLVNLRSVSNAENRKNQRLPRRNLTGVIGVDFLPNGFRARIVSDKKLFHLGYFRTLEEAAAARKTAEAKFGFHPNHGRSA